MRQKIQKRRYLLVFVITAIIFLLGFSMGFIINSQKSSIIKGLAEKQKVDYLSLQLQSIYMTSIDLNSSSSCRVMGAALDKGWESLVQSYDNLRNYKDSPDADKEEIKLLERTNILNDIRYWFFLDKAKTYCDLRDSVSLLFFYKEKDCGTPCDSQSIVLEYFKKVFGDRFLLFHLNADTEEAMIGLLATRYNITTYPAIVVNEKKFEGFKDKSELFSIICSQFKTQQPECK
ncbi:hypothetical protein HY643_03725 [Candidatus Woesearchaeota archaeon]|nr:hypothetical protein [Candidatus Woesearchaeota archaeon]